MADELEDLLTSLIDEEDQTNSSTKLPTGEEKEVYQLPVNGKVIGRFAPGQYLNPTHPKGHDGVDLMATQGTGIHPIASGVVIETHVSKIGGNTCKVSHENGRVVSYYAHMDSIKVKVGQQVNGDSVLGGVSNTGNATQTSPHLHFTVKVDGSLVDPFSIIGKQVGTLSVKGQLYNSIEKLSIQFFGEENKTSNTMRNM